MNILKRTRTCLNWFLHLDDMEAKNRIIRRVDRAEGGNFGDHCALGDGVSEMRIDYGPGYRIYFAREGHTIYLLLLGGDKRTQDKDIVKAKAIWQAIKGK